MNISTIIIAIIVFGVLIFIHEMGHFLAAKGSGVKVNEFALGMGPKIFSFKKGETQYALRLFPIGGFCAMEGDDQESLDSRSFGKANIWNRILIILSGSLMNLLLGLIILSILTMQYKTLGTTTIHAFKADAISNSSLMVGDNILKINNHRVRSDNDLIYEFIRDRDGIMDILVNRGGEKVLLPSVAFQMKDAGDGVKSIYPDFTVEGKEKTVGGVIQNSFNWTLSIIKQVWGSLVDLVTGRYSVNQLSGPVGVTTAIGQASSMGIKSLLMLVAFITVNLGVFNMLPLPALDGGRMMFLLLELVRRKPINPKYEGWVHAVGFVLLIGLSIFVTFNDVIKLF